MKAAVTTQGHGESSHGRVPAATVVHLFCGAGRLFKDAQRAPRTRRCVIMMRDWMDAAVLVRQEVNSDFNNWACFKPSSCLLVQDARYLQSGNHISLCFTVKWVSFNILREHDNGCRRLCLSAKLQNVWPERALTLASQRGFKLFCEVGENHFPPKLTKCYNITVLKD